MAAVERTYSFRGPLDVASRLREASRALAERTDDQRREAIASELARAFHAASPALRHEQSQSALMRFAVELLLTATEKVQRDLAYADEYRAVAADQEREIAVADTAARSAAELWRDG